MQRNLKVCMHKGSIREDCIGCDDFRTSCYPKVVEGQKGFN